MGLGGRSRSDLGFGGLDLWIEHRSVTYFGCEAVLRIPSERLRRPNPVPMEQGFSHGGFAAAGRGRRHGRLKKQNPHRVSVGVFFFRCLAMTYSHMGRCDDSHPHT